MKHHRLNSVFLSLLPALLASMGAAEGDPPASPEVAAAMQPYLDSYKLAGYIAIIADKTGVVHFRNIAGYADVEAEMPMREGNLFWIASMTKMFAGASGHSPHRRADRLQAPTQRHLPQLPRSELEKELSLNQPPW